jgi:hypothetical protein
MMVIEVVIFSTCQSGMAAVVVHFLNFLLQIQIDG